MSDQAPNIKDIINNTKNFDKPFAPSIPEGIHEVEVVKFEDGFSKEKHYRMLTLTVQDTLDRQARITQMLEIQWIEGTLRLVKGLYTKNSGTTDEEKEAAKEKINKFFDGAKDEKDLQDKIVEVLKNLVDSTCLGWLRVEKEHETDQYPDRALTAYEPTFRWKKNETAQEILESGDDVTSETAQEDLDLFNKKPVEE